MQRSPFARRRFLAFLVLLAGFGRAPAAQELSGVWTGRIPTPRGELETSFYVRATGASAWAGTADTPAQGVFGLPLTSIELDGDKVAFVMAHARYDGVLSEDRISGTWTQGSASVGFDCVRSPLPEPADDASVARGTGLWKGKLAAGAVKLRIVLAAQHSPQEGWSGYVQSPDQTPQKFPLTRVDWLADTQSFRYCVPSLSAALELTPNEDGSQVEGTFIQGAARLPITLERTEVVGPLRRPQTPKPPYPYDEEDVTYRNELQDVSLAGSLTLPRGEGSFPAVLLISGSGAQDRNGMVFEHQPFRVIADDLTRRGIAVLRVDDRGVGESTAGNVAAPTTADLATDVVAGVSFLAAHDRIDAGKLGLIGHSEGGIIAPLVARDDPRVAWLVLLAAPGVPGIDLLTSQNEALSLAAGHSAEDVKTGVAAQRALFEVALRTDLSRDGVREQVRELLQSAATAAGEVIDEAQMATAIAELESPWLLWFLRHDPAVVLREVTCPVLALNGTLDLQVPWQANLGAIRSALSEAQNESVRIQELVGLNHMFQTAETGLVSEYVELEETFAPSALTLLGDWLTQQAGL